MTPDQLTPTEAIEFLKKLPKSHLDDRDYKDLVNECLLRIPRYCPEWTNHNPADPGITLIEMFAWLTDQMLLRFNQVPTRQYIAYLELLGIELEPAKPAKTEVTFYFSRPQSENNNATTSTGYRPIPAIAAGTEVATERTDNQLAISFSTDHPLEIVRPRLSYFLTVDNISIERTGDEFLQAFAEQEVYDSLQYWNDDGDQSKGHAWSGRAVNIFRGRPPAPQNGFYLVLNAPELPEDEPPSLAGHVIRLDIRGRLAAPTGINPDCPPRCWKAWTGESWEDVLLQEADDSTFGFSFDEMGQGKFLEGGAGSGTITLHTPLSWKKATFDSVSGARYEGFWLCCVHNSLPIQNGSLRYAASPEFEGMTIAAVGGAVDATQCLYVKDELLGESNGKPGQQFSLQSSSILEPTEAEYLTVKAPGEGDPEKWIQVKDFANSSQDSLHYTLNLRTGVIQLGPLVREPQDLPKNVGLRRRIQKEGEDPNIVLREANRSQKQYGRVPPKGSILKMTRYRTGGGQKGDVQKNAICIPKRAIPYVTDLTNHKRAKGGIDQETLAQAVMRVPQQLRTQERAVTREDFETLALRHPNIQRVRCLNGEGGKVKVLLIPSANNEAADPKDAFELTQKLKDEVQADLEKRSLLGIKVELSAPKYVRVKVKVDISLFNAEFSDRQRRELSEKIQQYFCEFIHPTRGWWDGQGWPFDMPLHASDIVAYLHKKEIEQVRSVGNVQLFTGVERPRNSSDSQLQSNVRTYDWSQPREKLILEYPSQLFYAWEGDQESSSNYHAVQFPQ